MNSFLGYFDLQLNRASSIKQIHETYKANSKRLSQFYSENLAQRAQGFNQSISGIVFSKDRAMQLHALLSSYFFYTTNSQPLTILYTYSTEEHKNSYHVLQDEMKDYPLKFVVENNFAKQLKEIIKVSDADRLFFLTDDGLFVDHFDLNDCLLFNPFENIFSLRLGNDLDYCYSYDRPQMIPVFTEIQSETKKFNSWEWNLMKKSPDWIYPLSVDATVFSKSEISIMLNHLNFKNPNSLEYQMQLYNDLFVHRKGICYHKVKYVNVPCNIVQSEFDNISTGLFSTDELLHLFLDGKRINWKEAQNWNARNVQTMKYSFE
jgi:hypothetical protein